VGRVFRILACSVVFGLGLLTATNAMATGTTTSAGDQQYVDPLTTTTPSHASTAPAAPQPAPTSAPAAAPSSSTGPVSSSSAASAPAPQVSSSTLPYTGLDIGACVALGAGLLGAGLLLRRVMRRV
jgi:Alphavirus glycoprotein J